MKSPGPGSSLVLGKAAEGHSHENIQTKREKIRGLGACPRKILRSRPLESWETLVATKDINCFIIDLYARVQVLSFSSLLRTV